MKKTTICALLCSTIMLLGDSLAADDSGNSGSQITPITQRVMREKEKVDASLPSTPALKKQVESKIPSGNISSARRKLFVEAGVRKEKIERENERQRQYDDIGRREVKDRMKRDQEVSEEAARREALIYRQLIEEATKEKQEKVRENEALTAQIKELNNSIEKLEVNIEESKENLRESKQKLEETEKELNETGELSMKMIEEMDETIKSKTTLLNETKDNLLALEVKSNRLEIQLHLSKEAEKELKKGLERTIAPRAEGRGGSSSSLSPSLSGEEEGGAHSQKEVTSVGDQRKTRKKMNRNIS